MRVQYDADGFSLWPDSFDDKKYLKFLMAFQNVQASFVKPFSGIDKYKDSDLWIGVSVKWFNDNEEEDNSLDTISSDS